MSVAGISVLAAQGVAAAKDRVYTPAIDPQVVTREAEDIVIARKGVDRVVMLCAEQGIAALRRTRWSRRINRAGRISWLNRAHRVFSWCGRRVYNEVEPIENILYDVIGIL